VNFGFQEQKAMSSFPRGGSEPKKTGNSVSKSDSDALFGSKKRLARIEDKSGDSKKKSRAEAESRVGLASAIGAGMTKVLVGANTLKVEAVTFNKYQQGVQAYGYVLQIFDSRALISLPGGAVGSVELEDISDAAFRLVQSYKEEVSAKKQAAQLSGRRFNPAQDVLTPRPDIHSLLVPMQPVRVFVLGQEQAEGSKRRTLSLSMRSSHINRGLQSKHLTPDFPISGCIVSREDHGYIVSAGIAGTNLFLPLKGVPAAMGELSVGK
jgi:rRNA biogenesis protein RRP5